MNIFQRFLLSVGRGPYAKVIVTYQSERQRIRTRNQNPVVHFEAPFDGRRIMLLALYEKGALRPDVLRLIKSARDEGLYVLGVNTLKLNDPAQYSGLIDCYIERPNFGRDFASYKTGFLHIFNRGWETACPRILMINDSVFLTSERMPKFLNDLMTSDIEVLGSTENFDIEHHLGSFCISISNVVLQKRAFIDYWKNYRLSDLRPTVIKRGEMALTQVLKKCASSPDQFAALYNYSRYLAEMKSNPELLTFSIENVRMSPLPPWKSASLRNVVANIEARRTYEPQIQKVSELSSTSSISVGNLSDKLFQKHLLTSLSDVKEYFASEYSGAHVSDEEIIESALAEYSEGFSHGSHIHQNAAILLKQGLPIIKNDSLYRGVMVMEDLIRVSKQLPDWEARELLDVIMSRPLGAQHLKGWRLAAYFRGYL